MLKSLNFIYNLFPNLPNFSYGWVPLLHSITKLTKEWKTCGHMHSSLHSFSMPTQLQKGTMLCSYLSLWRTIGSNFFNDFKIRKPLSSLEKKHNQIITSPSYLKSFLKPSFSNKYVAKNSFFSKNNLPNFPQRKKHFWGNFHHIS